MFFLRKKALNLYITNKLDVYSRDFKTDFTISNCLFGAVKLTKNVDRDKYRYSVFVLDSMHVHNFHGHTVVRVKVL